jgi:FAD/FMN-containing dehydrogenase
MRCLDSNANVALPLRAKGAGTSATDCNSSPSGTVVDTTGLNRLVNIDHYNYTITAEAGVRISALVSTLAAQGLELIGNYDQTERTLGGALSSPCMGAGIGSDASGLSGQVLNMKIVTANGKLMKVAESQHNLLGALRLSYGMLGIIYEATLRVRPIATFSATHRSMDIDSFAAASERFVGEKLGVKFYLLPYRNQVYVDTRHYEETSGNAYGTPWKLKDWGESTVLPHVFRSLNRIMPIAAVRYRIIDGLTVATHELVNSRLVRNGNNVTAGGLIRRTNRKNLNYSTWCFPASDFSLIVKAYARFCRTNFAHTAYRCDMPAVGHLVARDTRALLSPSYDEPLIALRTISTQSKGWDNFALDLADFAESWGGTPLFNQTLATRSEYVSQTYAGRMESFRKIRRQLDPDNRLLNPYLARYFQ